MMARITCIREEAKEIKGFSIRLDSVFSYRPGQYVMLAFPDAPQDKKPFSVASYNSRKNELYLVIKKNGSFTQRLFSVNPGQDILVSGPYGRFVLPESDRPVIFIAGGIGITPLFCMLSHIAENGYSKNARLYYSARRKEDMALAGELEKIRKNNIMINYIFTENEKRLDAESFKDIPEYEEHMYYICGPTGMIDGFRSALAGIGVKEELIRSEDFAA